MAKVSMEQMETILNRLSGENNKPLRDWLAEYTKKPKVANDYYKRYRIFQTWTKKTPKQLVDEFSQKETRSLILQFQSYLASKGLKNNTIASYVTAIRSFYSSQCEEIRGLKRKVVQTEAASDEHTFSTEDLRKMYHIANTRNKALLTVGMSLGWEVSQVLDMETEFFKNLVKRARSEKLDFIAFNWTRPKTQSPTYGVLTPVAIDSLERYLEQRKDIEDHRLWHDLTMEDSLNDILRALAKEANIVLTGKIRWHLLRKWLMSNLDAAGLSEIQNKLILGKNIPVADSTYLQTLKREAFEKYQKAYPIYLSPVAYSNGNRHISQIGELVDILFQAQREMFIDKLKEMGVMFNRNLEPLEIVKLYIEIMERKRKRTKCRDRKKVSIYV